MAAATDAPEDIGDGLQGPGSRAVRAALEPLREQLRSLSKSRALAEAQSIVESFEKQPTWAALCSERVVKGRRVLKDEVLWNAHESFTPGVLRIRFPERAGLIALDHPIAPGSFEALHDLLVALHQGATLRDLDRLGQSGGLESFIEELKRAGWLSLSEDDAAGPEVHEEGLWFLGHNSVFVSSGKTRLVVDPWYRPWRESDPEGYRPVRPFDVGAPDAVLITHSHGDHFHLGSLLTMPRQTPIFVPMVERPSILTADLAALLRGLGYTNVRPMRWWESARVGDIEILAMPFHGEQPSSIDVVDPSLRNVGCTWALRTPSFSAAFLADTGRDSLGSMHDVALETRRRLGPIDIVFGGMRGFSMAPLFLPFTTLDAMFSNVPLELLAVTQRLMHDATDLLTVSEIFGAKWAVPYADGGAPWYWREGMGPAYAGYPSYPGERESLARDEEEPASAPFPERLEEVALERYGEDEALVEPLILRPGDLVRFSDGGVSLGRVEGFAWPWDG